MIVSRTLRERFFFALDVADEGTVQSDRLLAKGPDVEMVENSGCVELVCERVVHTKNLVAASRVEDVSDDGLQITGSLQNNLITHYRSLLSVTCQYR